MNEGIWREEGRKRERIRERGRDGEEGVRQRGKMELRAVHDQWSSPKLTYEVW